MRTQYVYSVFDKIDTSYSELSLHNTDESAKRYFINKINVTNESITQRYKSQGLEIPSHALVNINEFELHRIGTLDLDEGKLVSCENVNIPLND